MTDGEKLAQALRDARDVEKLNLFRSRARGEWQASAARKSNPNAWALGIDTDPVAALLKALDQTPSLAQRPADPAGIFD